MPPLVNPSPPLEVVTWLRRYDPELRLRWAHRTQLWAIERKCPPSFPGWLKERPNPYRSPRGLDRFDGWREGYMFVMFCHHDLLGTPAFETTVRTCDIQAQNGIEEINRQLDAFYADQEVEADRGIDHWAQAAARESHDRLQWLDGNRIATPLGPDRPPRPTDDYVIEHHDGFIVRLKKPSHVLPA